MSYIGSTPTTQSFISGTDTFSGTGSQTNFTLSRLVNTVNDIQVVVNNVVQYPPNYSISGNTLTISPAPSAGTNNVYVRYLSTTLQTFAPSQGTVGLAQLSATGTPSASNFLRGDNTWAVAAPPVDTQTFNSSGTWTKPSSGDFVRIQMWGGGGGGNRVATTNTAAGGGGGYFELTVPIASMGATATVTVGAAGVGRTGSAGAGTNGGNSGVTLGSGSIVYVSGGLGAVTPNGGSGGYGALTFDTTAVSDPAGNGQGGDTCTAARPGYSYTGGGGGAVGGGTGNKGAYGGGGGTRGTGAGGTSVFGGAGGNSAGAGVQPGGGGGCSSSANTNATNGGAGRVIITTF